jgi:NAD-dependent SIR2 family protein deacetylase
VKAIKDVDVVISTVGSHQIADQTRIIAAIKEAGNVKVTTNILNLKLKIWLAIIRSYIKSGLL